MIGGAIGGAIIVLAFGLLAWFYLRRRRRAEERALTSNEDSFTQIPSQNKHRIRSSSFGNRMVAPVLSNGPTIKEAISNPFLTATSKARQQWPFNQDRLSSPYSVNVSNTTAFKEKDPFADPPMRNPFDDIGPGGPPQIPAQVLQPALPKPHELRRDARRLGSTSTASTTSMYSTASGQVCHIAARVGRI